MDKNKKITIAVTGCRSAIGQSITRAAEISRRNYKVIVTDVVDEGGAIFPEIPFYKLVHVSSLDYREKLEDFLIKNKVDLMFLGSEKEMLEILEIRKELEEKTGVKFALSNTESASIGMDKLKTVEMLKRANLPYPKTKELGKNWKEIQTFIKKNGFPCVVKGKRAGAPFVVKNLEELVYHFKTYQDGIVQEFLGDENTQEYTVGVFNTQEYGIIDTYCMARTLKYGLTWSGRYEKNKEVEEISKKAVEILKPDGSVNVQLRYHKGRPTIHEFNVRCSSSTVFRALSGWNEIDMAVDYFLHNRKPKKPSKIKCGTGIRFFKEVWVNK
jgi:carbamoyl-phosphate synthase large subunit